jgi:serine/threonine protein kinase
MLGGYLPIEDEETDKMIDRTRNGLYHFHPKCWKHVSVAAKDLVVKCLNVNPCKRFGAKAAKQQKWMVAQKIKMPKTKLSTASLWKTTLQDGTVHIRPHVSPLSTPMCFYGFLRFHFYSEVFNGYLGSHVS